MPVRTARIRAPPNVASNTGKSPGSRRKFLRRCHGANSARTANVTNIFMNSDTHLSRTRARDRRRASRGDVTVRFVPYSRAPEGGLNRPGCKAKLTLGFRRVHKHLVPSHAHALQWN